MTAWREVPVARFMLQGRLVRVTNWRLSAEPEVDGVLTVLLEPVAAAAGERVSGPPVGLQPVATAVAPGSLGLPKATRLGPPEPGEQITPPEVLLAITRCMAAAAAVLAMITTGLATGEQAVVLYSAAAAVVAAAIGGVARLAPAAPEARTEATRAEAAVLVALEVAREPLVTITPTARGPAAAVARAVVAARRAPVDPAELRAAVVARAVVLGPVVLAALEDGRSAACFRTKLR